MYGHEKPTYPLCVKRRTGFVVTFEKIPVIWKSKLQTETTLSTMEAEAIAMAHSRREFFPIVDMAKNLSGAVGLLIGDITMNVSIQEDNSDAFVLVDTLPNQFIPCRNYYASETILFRKKSQS